MGAGGNQMKGIAQIAFEAASTLAVAIAAIGLVGSAVAQVATVKGAGDEMKVLYQTPAEVAEGSRIADTACKNCHGPNGISATKDIPHLAAQRAPYLYLELKAYKQGARGDNAMAAAVRYMSEDSLMKAAAYYASLDPAPPAAAAAIGFLLQLTNLGMVPALVQGKDISEERYNTA